MSPPHAPRGSGRRSRPRKPTRPARAAAAPAPRPTRRALNRADQIAAEKHPVTGYARAVASGKIVACRWVKLAAARHLRDLRDRRLSFDTAAADHALDFYGYLRHYKGESAGQPFVLEAWQIFIIGSLFGWKWARGDRAGLRRFKYAYIEVPRKNGKTTLAAGIAGYLLVADGEAGAEVYFAATKEDQAKIGWNDLGKIIKRSPGFAEFIRVKVKDIIFEPTDSVCRPLGSDSDTLDGLNPHGGVLDELHAWKTAALRQVIVEATLARRQPLIFQITTAGSNRLGPCFEERAHVTSILESATGQDAYADEEYFGIIYTLDAESELYDEPAWIKANPNLGVSKYLADLRSEVNRTRLQPSKRNAVLQKQFDIWTEQEERWLDPDAWTLCASKLKLAELRASLRGRPCFGAFDLSEKIDLSAFVLWFPIERVVLPFFWMPEDTIAYRREHQRTPYWQWAEAGHIKATEGNAVDHDVIRADVLALKGEFDIREIGFDPWNATQTSIALQKEGCTMVEIRQGYRSLSEPSKELERLNVTCGFTHPDNPVFNWMARNVTIKRDENGNIRPVKPDEKSVLKIDGIVAFVMALCRAVVQPAEETSVYATRGVITI